MILMSAIAALLLDVLSLPEGLGLYWPLWMVMLLIFMAIYLPGVMSPWLIWFLGIFNDVISSNMLGEHALAFIVVYFLALMLGQHIKILPLGSQLMRISVLLLTYQMILFFMEGLAWQHSMWLLLPIFTSLLVWPWIASLLRRIAIKFYIHRL